MENKIYHMNRESSRADALPERVSHFVNPHVVIVLMEDLGGWGVMQTQALE